jgi:hypothetical protein
MIVNDFILAGEGDGSGIDELLGGTDVKGNFEECGSRVVDGGQGLLEVRVRSFHHGVKCRFKPFVHSVRRRKWWRLKFHESEAVNFYPKFRFRIVVKIGD